MGFLDSVKNYKAGQATTVPLNPPEAQQVLETQSAPEVANVRPVASAAPLAAQPTAVSATEPSAVAALPSTPAVEESRRKRRTKAEMEAARAAVGSAVPSGESAPPVASVSSPTDGGFDMSEITTEELTSELARRGYSGTLSF